LESIQDENTNSPGTLDLTSLEPHLANLTVQLYSITTKKDGGGRIQFEFGADALGEIGKIQRTNGQGGMNFQLVVVPSRLIGTCSPLAGL
jgi:hypothetical protein